MPLWSAMRFREACAKIADVYGKGEQVPIELRNRYDQNPNAFAIAAETRNGSS